MPPLSHPASNLLQCSHGSYSRLLLLPVPRYLSAWLFPCSYTIGCCHLSLFHTSDRLGSQPEELCRPFPPFSVSVDEKDTPEETADSLPAFPQACLVHIFPHCFLPFLSELLY